jgi:hypothetical protein
VVCGLAGCAASAADVVAMAILNTALMPRVCVLFAGIAVSGSGGTSARREVFFFEKKKQKTFGLLSRTYPAAYAKGKSFLVLFFKKELLSF